MRQVASVVGLSSGRVKRFRCSVLARSGLEGATVRWRGYASLSESDTGPVSGDVNGLPDDGLLRSGLIAYRLFYTTSGVCGIFWCAPFGRRFEETNPSGTGGCGTRPVGTAVSEEVAILAKRGPFRGPERSLIWVGWDLAGRWGGMLLGRPFSS